MRQLAVTRRVTSEPRGARGRTLERGITRLAFLAQGATELRDQFESRARAHVLGEVVTRLVGKTRWISLQSGATG